ncbi:MAG: M13 family peptidase [Ignavibacteriae bacterium]|nr:MAG: M13 family peptidase [Ignavibacteriota bacterium]
MNNRLALLLLVVSIFYCSFSFCQPQGTPDPLIAHIDSTVRPGDDFFLFANGKWFKENPIPASEPSNGLWQIIQDTINAQILSVCESSAGLMNAEKGSNKQKIGDFFRTGMDSVSLNQQGISELNVELARIEGITSLKDVAGTAAYMHVVAGAPLFRFGVGQDDKISSKNAVFISQGGISLPDRRFYFDTDERSLSIRQKFVRHVGNMFKIIGYDKIKSQRAAEHLMKLETAIAQTSRKREDTRDPVKNYNKISYNQLLSTAPNFDWTTFLANAGFTTTVDTVIVGQPEFLTALDGYLTSFPLDDWKEYLKYHLVSNLARCLDDKTYLENFNFYSAVLRGVEEPKPRWKRVVEQSDRLLGELIGQVYVAEYLPKGTKEKLLEIGNAIKAVYAERIKRLDWMSDATKVKALKKLNTIIMKVGYPDTWKDLRSMEIGRSSYVRNVMNANAWHTTYMISKYGKPVDRSEWDMEPQTYNAYYNPSNNEICVPGCNIIVPGFERVIADDAILYSIIGGSTFGHEMTHGFDDQGCQYDELGNLNNWWTTEDSTKFFAKTKMIVKQFDGYIAVDSLHINGELTQGENIADLAGVMMGYEAFKSTRQFQTNEIIAGLNPNERFFLGYAFAWMINTRPEGIASQLQSDVHSPAKFRVIGPLADIPEFYTTFGVKEGDAMWRPAMMRVKIW